MAKKHLPAPQSEAPAPAVARQPMPGHPLNVILDGVTAVSGLPDASPLLELIRLGDTHGNADFVNKTIQLTNFLCELREKIDFGTGEVARFPRVVLVTQSDELIDFGSVGMFYAIRALVGRYGMPPWDPPLVVRIVARGDKMRQFYTLEEVKDA
ncbi:MAG TPA: hypothetical protein VJ808_05045 [Gemmatimonadales bacterium]|nr:hypothetical protein [Gemmatimonadales bacterium]